MIPGRAASAVRAVFRAAVWRELFSRRCRACGAPVSWPGGHSPDPAGPQGLCAACAVELAPRLCGLCPRCGAMGDDSLAGPRVCAACLAVPPPQASLVFHAPYGGLLRDMIKAFKFGERPEHGAVLRGLFAAAFDRAMAADREGIASAGVELVAPVPLHPARLAWRGFNQSLELARPLARKYGWPIVPAALVRVRRTKPQSTLSGRERRENIRGAFAADAALVRGRRVLLTDDVMTTGATVEACARALIEAGAARVDVAVLAR